MQHLIRFYRAGRGRVFEPEQRCDEMLLAIVTNRTKGRPSYFLLGMKSFAEGPTLYMSAKFRWLIPRESLPRESM